MNKEIKLDEGIKEFFELLKYKFNEIRKIYSNFQKLLELYNSCCNYDSKRDLYVCSQEKIEKLLSTKNGTKTFTKLLMEVFGYDFFNYSEEEMLKLKEKNVATKQVLPLIFEGGIGFFKGKLIEIPKNYDDFTMQIKNIIDLLNDNSISEKERESISKPFITIENIIANRYKELMDSISMQNIVISGLQEIIKSYDKNQVIKTNNDDKLAALLNRNFEYEITHNDEKITNEDIGFGELLKSIINDYNDYQKVKSSKMLLDNLLKKLKGKNASEAESKIDSVSKNMIRKFTQNKLDEQSLIIFEYLLDKESENSWNQDSYEYYKAINELAMDCTSYMHKNKIYSDSVLASKIVGNYSI